MTSDHTSSDTGMVLVVEDDADIRETLVMLLEFDGYRVAAVSDGLQALEWLSREQAPSLVLLDLMMPNLDGLGFLRRWQARGSTADCAVVVLSGADVRGPIDGAACVLQKPVATEELLQCVQRFTKRGR
jgi:two-component system response regulator MprA